MTSRFLFHSVARFSLPALIKIPLIAGCLYYYKWDLDQFHNCCCFQEIHTAAIFFHNPVFNICRYNWWRKGYASKLDRNCRKINNGWCSVQFIEPVNLCPHDVTANKKEKKAGPWHPEALMNLGLFLGAAGKKLIIGRFQETKDFLSVTPCPTLLPVCRQSMESHVKKKEKIPWEGEFTVRQIKAVLQTGSWANS